jgi:hypothetical protein
MRRVSFWFSLALLSLPLLAQAQARQHSFRINSPTLANQYGRALDKTGLQSNAAYTLEAWVNPDSYTNFPTIISNGFQHSFWLGLNTAGRVRFYPVDQAHGYFEGGIVIPTGRWTHIAAVHSGTVSSIYVNGVLDTQNISIAGIPPADSAALCVGADRGDASTNYYWRGRLDEVRIWSKARTAAEIQAQMTLPAGDPGYYPAPAYKQMKAYWTFENTAVGSAFDFARETGDVNALGYVNGDYSSLIDINGAPVAVNTAMSFDGATDYMDTGMGDGFAAGVSIEAWLIAPPTAAFQAIVGRDFITSFWLGLTPDQHLRFYPTGGVGQYVDSDDIIPANRWVQVAATYKDGQIALYKNGGLIPFHGPAISGSVGESGLPAYIGGDNEGGLAYPFRGAIDEVRITRGRLSAQSIAKDRLISWEPYANPLSRPDADGIARESQHFSTPVAVAGLHGTQLARVRSGAPLSNPLEMNAISSQNVYGYALSEMSPPLSETPVWNVFGSAILVPYNVPVSNPSVFVDATISDLNYCQLTLQSPSATVVSLLDMGSAHGRDLLTIIQDASPNAFATSASPFLDSVHPDHPLSAFNGQSSQGYWSLTIAMTSPEATDMVTWGIHFQNTPAAVGGPAPGAVSLAIRGANPARGSAQLEYSLPTDADVDLALFDVGGRRVAKLYAGHSPAGMTVLHWNAAHVAPGTYFARLSVNGETRAQSKLTLLR